MRNLILFFIVFSTANVLGAPCGGAQGHYYSNPDGSLGGFVQNASKVAPTVFIDSASEVCGHSELNGTVRIELGSIIEENVTIEGSAKIIDSHVFGHAKISGGAIVQGATICQASLIEGIKVINSDYYCQTEDPSPKDPGENGKQTLLGVDSDGDGVRDDIEIYINNLLFNTAKKNKSQERIATKLYAKMLQREFASKSNAETIKSILQFKVELDYCYELTIREDVFRKMYNTRERLFSLFKVVDHVNGEKVRVPNAKCKTLGGFIRAVNEL